MPNKCGVVNCKGNYNAENKCRVFKLPKDCENQKKWFDVIPIRKDFRLNPTKFFICERHWPVDSPTETLPGGFNRPAVPPSIFNVPPSCLPTVKTQPRKTNIEDAQLDYFLKKDNIDSLSEFLPENGKCFF